MLTILAVAFFLDGLAQTMQAVQLQRFFGLSGAAILFGTVVWTAAILVSSANARPPPEDTHDPYAAEVARPRLRAPSVHNRPLRFRRALNRG